MDLFKSHNFNFIKFIIIDYLLNANFNLKMVFNFIKYIIMHYLLIVNSNLNMVFNYLNDFKFLDFYLKKVYLLKLKEYSNLYFKINFIKYLYNYYANPSSTTPLKD